MGSTTSIPSFPKAIQFLTLKGVDILSVNEYKYGSTANLSYKGESFRFTHSLGCMELRHSLKGLSKFRRMSAVLGAMERVVLGGLVVPPFTKTDSYSICVDMWDVVLNPTECELRFHFRDVPLDEEEEKWNVLNALLTTFSRKATRVTSNRQVIVQIPESMIEPLKLKCNVIESLNIALKWNDYRQK